MRHQNTGYWKLSAGNWVQQPDSNSKRTAMLGLMIDIS